MQYNAVNAIVATALNPEIRARIAKVGREAACAPKVRDQARVDVGLTDDGRAVVLEVNTNPYQGKTSAFALAALQAGMGYSMLINSIVESAWKRCARPPLQNELQKNRAGRTRIRRLAAQMTDSSGASSTRAGAAHGKRQRLRRKRIRSRNPRQSARKKRTEQNTLISVQFIQRHRVLIKILPIAVSPSTCAA